MKRPQRNHHPRIAAHRSQLSFFAIAALILATLTLTIVGSAKAKPANAQLQIKQVAYQATHLPVEGQLPSFGKGVDWLNSKPLTPADLGGKVVLIEFWTYSCINWRRQLPYVRAWSQRYKPQGLIVIGVHSPEFSFEKNLDNVRQGVKDTRVDFPVVIDNDHAIWRAFNNEYWPALYFVDAKGRIRHHQFGEGEYQQSELILQQLLQEAGAGEPDHKVVALNPMGAEAAPDWTDMLTPETYVGYDRTENFASPAGAKHNKSRDYTAPTQLKLNHWALSGNWKVGSEAVVPDNPGGRIVYQFHARDLHLVMGPAVPGTPVRFRVLIDGQPPGAAHGGDVDEQGNGTITEPRMYQLIRQQKPIVDRRFEIEFLDPGVEAFSFTFG